MLTSKLMENLAKRTLSMMLAATMVLGSGASANPTSPTRATPDTQVGDGGGGQLPPGPPPTDYFGGGSGGDMNGAARSSATPPRTFQVYQLDAARNPVYYEGQAAITQDANGKEIRYQRVFQFLNVTNHSVGSEIQRGLLIPDSHYLDTYRMEWSPNLYTLGEMMLEVATERSKNLRKSIKKGIVSTESKGAFEVYWLSADGRDVYFEGKKDKYGRERVFRSTSNSGFIDRGYIKDIQRGEIEWSEKNTERGKALTEISKSITAQAPKGIQQARLSAETQTKALEKFVDPKAGKPYPNYPEVKNGEKSPLPRGRSLVVTDGKTTTHSPYQRINAPPSGSGSAAVSSPYRYDRATGNEFYGDERWKAGRPAELNKTLEWSRAKGERLKTSVHEYLDGKPAKAAEKTGKAAVELSRVSATFYLALGIFTAYELGMNYSSNPRAATAYLETGTDPIFYLSMATFLAASEPFFRRMGPITGPAKNVLPWFAGAVVFGGIASHLVSDFLSDKNFRKCVGFSSFDSTGAFKRDIPACNELYDKWANYEWDKELLPLVTNLTASAGFFYGSLRMLKALGQRNSVQTAVGSVVRVFKVPPTSFLRSGGAQTIGLMALFLAVYQVNSEYIQLGSKVSEMYLKYNPDLLYPLRAPFDLATKGYVSSTADQYGNSLNDVEKKLLREWKLIQQVPLRNGLIKVGCNSQASYSQRILNDCHNAGFPEVLKRYAKLHSQWREFKMKPVDNVFQSWAAKVYSYNNSISSSYNFYKQLVALKAEAIRQGHSDHRLDDATLSYLRDFVNLTEAPTDYREAWSHVMPVDYFDFMLTSASCGPEAEPFGQNGFIRSAYSTFFGKSPTRMADDSMWSDIRFFPPRITQPMPGNQNICDKPVEGLNLIPFANGIYRPLEFPYNKNAETAGWGSSMNMNNRAVGLHNFLMDNMRESIIDARGVDHFDDWWNEHVAVPHEKLQAVFRNQYKKMLTDRYIPIMTEKSYLSTGGLIGWCEMNAKEYQMPSLHQHLRLLGKGTDCAPDATHRLAIGVFNSLEDELRLYSAMLLDLHQSISGQRHAALEKSFLEAAELLQQMEKYLVTTDQNSRPNLQNIIDRFGEIATILYTQHFYLSKLAQSQSADSWHIEIYTDVLQEHINSVFAQAADYIKIIINFETSVNPTVQ